MREPFTGTLPCPLGRRVLRPICVWLACLSAAGALGKSGQQCFDRWLLLRSSAISELAKRPEHRCAAECGFGPLSRIGSIRPTRPRTSTPQSLLMSEMRPLGCMTLCAHKRRGYSRSGRRMDSTVSSLSGLYECAPRKIAHGGGGSQLAFGLAGQLWRCL